MKKIVFVTLLLSCLGTSSFKLAGAAAATPYYREELKRLLNIEWIPEKKAMIVTHSEDTRIVISWKNIGFMDKENKMLSFPFIENYLTQMKKIQGDKERKKKILTEDADPQRKEKKEMLYEYIQAILMNFFNNDESLTHLHSRDKMSFFKMNSLSGPSHKIYVLQLPF